MKIISLRAENVKKLKAVEITPEGNVVEITGKNGAGKTSTLDAIYWALAGSGTVQKLPIRQGCEEAIIKLDLGTLKVIRTFKAKEGGHTTTLTVSNADGFKADKPQKTLDQLLDGLCFDPLAFTRMKPDEQFDAVRKLVPDVDFIAIDNANDADFKKRTAINVEAKSHRAQAAGIPEAPEDLEPAIDEMELIERLESAAQHNSDIADRKARREAAVDQIDVLKQSAADKTAQAADLRARADALDADIAALTKNAADLQSKLDNAEELPAPIDTVELRQLIDSAREHNTKVSGAAINAARRAELIKSAQILEAQSEALTKAMDERTAKKEAAIAAAKLPVDGIGFGDGFVTLNGVPLNQASDAEQLRCSIAIAAALNPKLRVIRVRDGSLLDSDSWALLGKMADENDMQVWVETVASDRPGAIVIEDGQVKGQNLEAAE